MKLRMGELIALLLVVSAFALTTYFYPLMPDQMESHWNMYGQADGYMPKFWGLFLMPLIAVGLFALFEILPRIDPLRANVLKFRNYFDGFVILVLAFLIYLHALVIAWNLGLMFNFILRLVPAFAALFFYIGILLNHSKRNWFIGIRTPWAMSSDDNWNKTHKRGAKLFKACAIVTLAGIVLPDYAFVLLLAPVIASCVYLYAYSYSLSKKKR